MMTRKVISAKRRVKNEVEDPRIEAAVLILRKMLGSLRREVEPKAS
jgi:hypothetical protein